MTTLETFTDEEQTILLNLVEREIGALERKIGEPAGSSLYPLMTRVTNAWRGLDLLRPIRAKLAGRKP